MSSLLCLKGPVRGSVCSLFVCGILLSSPKDMNVMLRVFGIKLLMNLRSDQEDIRVGDDVEQTNPLLGQYLGGRVTGDVLRV